MANIYMTICVTSVLTLCALAMPTPDEPHVGGVSQIYHQQDSGIFGNYNFGYKIDDPFTGNHQHRDESRDENGVVRGSYSLIEPDGNLRTVYYVADKFGFRAYVDNSHKPDSSHGEESLHQTPESE
ncbi:hypothetical protein CHUAL_005054 [Chamberlinius hualienensis]